MEIGLTKGKMIWSQFSTKVLQRTILDINDWDRSNFQYSKENSSLEQNSSLHNQIHDIINLKYIKKEKGEEFQIFSRTKER